MYTSEEQFNKTRKDQINKYRIAIDLPSGDWQQWRSNNKGMSTCPTCSLMGFSLHSLRTPPDCGSCPLMLLDKPSKSPYCCCFSLYQDWTDAKTYRDFRNCSSDLILLSLSMKYSVWQAQLKRLAKSTNPWIGEIGGEIVTATEQPNGSIYLDLVSEDSCSFIASFWSSWPGELKIGKAICKEFNIPIKPKDYKELK